MIIALSGISCTKSKRDLPVFIVTEGVPSGEYYKWLESPPASKSQVEGAKFKTFLLGDKRVMWACPAEDEFNAKLDQIIELPPYTGSPVGYLRLIVERSGVAIRTYGTRLRTGPIIRNVDYALDFDSTIQVPERKASIREHIANSIPPSYMRSAITIYDKGDVFQMQFVGMPKELPANDAQRKAEGNPLSTEGTAKDAGYYAKYSYEDRTL